MSKSKIYEALLVISIAFLVPVATLYRFTQKDKLRLKKGQESEWVNRDHKYSAGVLYKAILMF